MATIKGINVEIGGNTVGLTKALEDVNKKSNQTSSELRQIEKALKLNPDSVVLIKQKQDLLNQSFSASTERLKVLKATQQEVENQFKDGKIDDGQYRAFQREIEKASAEVKKFAKEKESITKVKVAVAEVKEKFSELNDKIDPVTSKLKVLGKAAKGITIGGIKTVGAIAEGAAKGVAIYAGAVASAATATAKMAIDSAAAADELNTISTQTGLSVEELQKFKYASEIIDVDVETLTKSMAKLTRNMSAAQRGMGEQTEAFKALGVNVTGVDGKLRNNNEVFTETIKKLGAIENETQRDAYAMAIFGKSAQDLNPLIKGGAEQLEILGNSAEKMGLIMSGEAVDSLNELDDSICLLKANAAASAQVLSSVFSNSIKGLTDVLGAELPNITKAIGEIFKGGGTEDSEQSLSNSLGEIITTAIDGLVSNAPAFLKTFNAVLVSLIGGIITMLPFAIKNILPTLMSSFGELISGLVELAPLLLESGMQFIFELMNGISQALPNLIQTFVAMIPKLVEQLTNNLPAILEAGISIIVELAKGLPLAIPALISAIPDIILAIVNAFFEQDWLQIGVDILKGIGEGLWKGLTSLISGIGKLATNLVDAFKGVFKIHSPSQVFSDEIGKYLADGIEVGFSDEMKDVNIKMSKAISPKVNKIDGGTQEQIGGQSSDIKNVMENIFKNLSLNGKIVLEIIGNDSVIAKGLKPKLVQLMINDGDISK